MIGAVLLLGGPVTSARADGCGCGCLFNVQPFFAGTRPGPHAVTSSARLFAQLQAYDASTVSLVDDADVPVAFTLTPADDSGGTAFWLTPDASLGLGRHYRLTATRRDGSVFRTELVVDATVGRTPPSVTGLRVRLPESAPPRLCGDLRGLIVEWDALHEVLLEDAVVEVEVQRAGAVIGRTFARSVPYPDGTTTRWLGAGADPDCVGGAWLPDLDGDLLDARLRVWDQAGQATGWIEVSFEPVVLGVGSPPPCPARSCTATGARSRPDAFCWAIALAALVHRGCLTRSRGRVADPGS